jgi:hypothetical protein
MAYDLVIKGDEDKNNIFISLSQGAGYSGYSQDYLRFRIRQGKLRAKKIGRNWLTTKEWLDEYLQKVSDYKTHLVALKSKETEEVSEKPQEENLPPEVSETPEVLEEPQMNEDVGALAMVAEKDEGAPEEIEQGEEEESDDDDGLIYQAKKPNQNPAYDSKRVSDDQIRLLFDPQPLAVFQEAELEAQEGAKWPALAFVLLFLCGVLGFMAGFKYPSFEPFLAQAKDATINEAKLLVNNLTSPILAEQFTASFGIIMDQIISPTPKPIIKAPENIKTELSPTPPLPEEPKNDSIISPPEITN